MHIVFCTVFSERCMLSRAADTAAVSPAILWMVRQRFERECAAARPAGPAANPERHACWNVPGAIVCINAALRVYGCTQCMRTHHCRIAWETCIKANTETSAKVCVFSGAVVASDEMNIGSFREEIRVASTLRLRPPSEHGFSTRTTSKRIRNSVRRIHAIRQQSERTGRLLSASQNGDSANTDGQERGASAHVDVNQTLDPAAHNIGADNDDTERPRKRIRLDESDSDSSRGDSADDALLLATLDDDNGNAPAPVNDEWMLDDRRGVTSSERIYEAHERGESGYGSALANVFRTDADLGDGDGNERHDEDDGDGADKESGAVMEAVYMRLDSGGDMRLIGLSADAMRRSNESLMQEASDIPAPWTLRSIAAADPVLDTVHAKQLSDIDSVIRAWRGANTDDSKIYIHTAGGYLQRLHETAYDTVAAALLNFDSQNYAIMEIENALARALPAPSAQLMAASEHDEKAPCANQMHADYLLAVHRARLAVRGDVRAVVSVLGASLNSHVRCARTEIYERVAVRLFDVLRHFHPMALVQLRACRVGVALLLDLLHAPYYLSDQHTLTSAANAVATNANGTLRTPALLNILAQSQQRSARVLVWNADTWLTSRPIRAIVDALLVADAKPIMDDASLDAVPFAAAVRAAATAANGTLRFTRASVKTWSTQLRALIQQTPITPYALRDALFR